MHIWQVQEAKAKLTQLMKEAQVEPQMISRHGICEIVVMSVIDYEKLVSKEESMANFLKKSPLNGVDFELKWDKTKMREIDL